MVVCMKPGKPGMFIFSVLEMSTEEDTSLAASRMDPDSCGRVGRGEGQLNLETSAKETWRTGLSQCCELLHSKDLCM